MQVEKREVCPSRKLNREDWSELDTADSFNAGFVNDRTLKAHHRESRTDFALQT